jgi:TIR domain
MRTGGKHQVPGDTQVEIRHLGGGRVNAKVALPGATEFRDLGRVPIIDGEIVLPIFSVFLCHADEDSETVARISEKLWQRGYVTWFDKKDLLPGDEWQRAVEVAIDRSDYAIVCISRRSLAKHGFVNREVRLILRNHENRPLGGRYIVPILLDDAEIPHEIRDIHCVRYSDADWLVKVDAALRSSRSDP